MQIRKLAAAGISLLLAAPLAFAQTAATATTQTTTTTAAPKRTINQRERRQQKRIAQGVNSGELTAKEAAKLEKREAAIERREDKMRASGGKFTKGERKAINKQLNAESRQIYKQKHDKQKR